MYVLEELGLIEFSREEPSPTRQGAKALARRYYKINHDGVNDIAWKNPYSKLYHDNQVEVHGA